MSLKTCDFCDRMGIVSLGTTSPEGNTHQLLCMKHARELPMISEVLDLMVPAEESILELVAIVEKTHRLPIELQLLPSGAVNPIFSRTDLAAFDPIQFSALLRGELKRE